MQYSFLKSDFELFDLLATIIFPYTNVFSVIFLKTCKKTFKALKFGLKFFDSNYYFLRSEMKKSFSKKISNL